MGKVCTKHILRLLWKMVESMFFLDREHVMVGTLPPKNLLFLLSVGKKQVQVGREFPPIFPRRISEAYLRPWQMTMMKFF